MLFFISTNIVVLGLTAAVSWWLSGYDTKLPSVNAQADLARRFVRCFLTLLLVEPAFYGLWQYAHYRDTTAGMLYLIAALPLALLWSGCVSQMLAHTLSGLIDPEDRRVFDPAKEIRDLNAIAELIRGGKRDEAIQMCETLKASGEMAVSTLELTLEHLGVPQKGAKMIKPLTQADRLRSEGKFSEAELILNSLLLENPRNVDATMMLVRLYAQDLQHPDKATDILHKLEMQPGVSPQHIEFAYRSIAEWSKPKPPEPETVAPPETVDEMLAKGFFGSAVQALEVQIEVQPQDFDLRMKLLEVQAVYCKNLPGARSLVRELAGNPDFSPEQIEFAQAQLKQWSQ